MVYSIAKSVLYKCPLSARILFTIVSFPFVYKKGTFDGYDDKEVLHTPETPPSSATQLSLLCGRDFSRKLLCVHMWTNLLTPERQKGNPQQIKVMIMSNSDVVNEFYLAC